MKKKKIKIVMNCIIVIVILYNMWFLAVSCFKLLRESYVLKNNGLTEEIVELVNDKKGELYKEIELTKENILKITVEQAFPDGYNTEIIYKDLTNNEKDRMYLFETDKGLNSKEDKYIMYYMREHGKINYWRRILYYSVLIITLILIVIIVWKNLKGKKE